MSPSETTQFLDPVFWLWHAVFMPRVARKMLDRFSSEDERQEIAAELLQGRAIYESLDDGELVLLADQVFLELDRDESQD
jgi:hypothetical protein